MNAKMTQKMQDRHKRMAKNRGEMHNTCEICSGNDTGASVFMFVTELIQMFDSEQGEQKRRKQEKNEEIEGVEKINSSNR